MSLEDEINALRANHTQEQLMQMYKEMVEQMKPVSYNDSLYYDLLDQMDVIWFAMDTDSHKLIDEWIESKGQSTGESKQ